MKHAMVLEDGDGLRRWACDCGWRSVWYAGPIWLTRSFGLHLQDVERGAGTIEVDERSKQVLHALRRSGGTHSTGCRELAPASPETAPGDVGGSEG